MSGRAALQLLLSCGGAVVPVQSRWDAQLAFERRQNPFASQVEIYTRWLLDWGRGMKVWAAFLKRPENQWDGFCPNVWLSH